MKLLSVITGTVAPFKPDQGLRDLKKAGFEHLYLDFNIFCSKEEIKQLGKKVTQKEYLVRDKIIDNPAMMLEYPKLLIDKAKQQGFSCDLALSPVHPYFDENKIDEHPDFVLDRAIDCIKLCNTAGCENLVVYPFSHEQRDIDRVTEWYEKMIPAAKEYGVKIIIANQLKNCYGHLVKGIFADSYELAAWIDKENEKAGYEAFGVMLDVGTANICGQDIHEMIRVLGNRIVAVSLKENNGYEESALIPFSCPSAKPDYLGLIRGLREIDFDGLIVLEMTNTYTSYSTLMRPSVMQMGKTVGDYFIWQIGMEKALKKYPKRVLFGAGNMCRNYMKCYGKDYPPLFTCDNNEKMWGQTFEGLDVKNPGALKDLPEDCVIYICNLYYREIKEQLINMGIKNQVENFNDEYLPSYHTDRIAYRFE